MSQSNLPPLQGFQFQDVPPLSSLIVAVEKGQRGIVGSRSQPAGFTQIGPGVIALDLTLRQLDQAGKGNTAFLGSHQIGKVVTKYPSLRVLPVHIDEDHEEFRLPKVQLEGTLLALRADVVYSEAFFRNFGSEGESATCAYIEGETALHQIVAVALNLSTGPLSLDSLPFGLDVGNADFLSSLADYAAPNSTSAFDASGLCALVHDEDERQRILFPGKAGTLEQLRGLLTHSQIPNSLRIGVGEWRRARDSVIERICETFPNTQLAIRSSARGEDTVKASAAGYFVSRVGVASDDPLEVANALHAVVASFTRDGRSPDEQDEVLVQEKVQDVLQSGVAFSRSLRTGGPYFVISRNGDRARTDVVTSGDRGEIETLVISHSCEKRLLSALDASLISTLEEICTLSLSSAIDVEFCVSQDQTIWILQVRPMVRIEDQHIADSEVLAVVDELVDAVKLRQAPLDGVAGRSTVLANMSDWNPAEMLGAAPSPMALSLYKRIIGASAWSRARKELGYRDVTGRQLIVDLAGKPYVDVRLSMNSLVPQKVPIESASVWIDHCLNSLTNSPELQDKVEFDLFPSIFDFSWPRWSSKMVASGLHARSVDGYGRELVTLTTQAIENYEARLEGARFRTKHLERWTAEVRASQSRNFFQRREVLSTAIQSCVTQGTESFALVARLAFMALQLLKSAVTEGLISQEQLEGFLGSIPSLGTQFSDDLVEVRTGSMSREDLAVKYGHLRPHSYEVTSPAYRDGLLETLGICSKGDRLNGLSAHADADRSPAIPFELLATLLTDQGVRVSADALKAFARETIKSREEIKFSFMKTLDLIITEIQAWASDLGFEVGDVAYLTIEELLAEEFSFGSSVTLERFRKLIEFRKKARDFAGLIQLPDVIGEADSLHVHKVSISKPTFPVRQSVQAFASRIGAASNAPESLYGRIVITESADPGYDWIFMAGIAGLITAYGGTASHMAIRCAELAIPAAIGCGPDFLDSIQNGQLLLIDGLQERVEML